MTVVTQTDPLERLIDAVRAVVEQQRKIDARFRQWMADDTDTGGATAQRNMERKRDRLSYDVTTLLYADAIRERLGADGWGALAAVAECNGYDEELLTALEGLR